MRLGIKIRTHETHLSASKTGVALPKAGALRRRGDRHNTRRIAAEGLRDHQGLTRRGGERTASNGGTIVPERTAVVWGRLGE